LKGSYVWLRQPESHESKVVVTSSERWLLYIINDRVYFTYV